MNPGNTFWKDAAKNGAVIGLILLVVLSIDCFLKLQGTNSILRIVEFAALAALIYMFGKKRSDRYGDEGYSYGQSMGYILAMMLFTGFVYGVGDVMLRRVIAPEYYRELLDITVEQARVLYNTPQMEQALEMVTRMFTNPVFVVISDIFNWIVTGGIVGLLASIFLKRNPVIFNNTDES